MKQSLFLLIVMRHILYVITLCGDSEEPLNIKPLVIYSNYQALDY